MSADAAGVISDRKVVYLHDDHLGSIESITRPNTATQHFKYDPFGLRVDPQTFVPAQGASDVTDGFSDQEHDDELGLINMRGRMYDPKIGRFLSIDPLVSEALSSQGFNRYSYVSNNPLNLVDPSGFKSKDGAARVGCGPASNFAACATGGSGDGPTPGSGGDQTAPPAGDQPSPQEPGSGNGNEQGGTSPSPTSDSNGESTGTYGSVDQSGGSEVLAQESSGTRGLSPGGIARAAVGLAYGAEQAMIPGMPEPPRAMANDPSFRNGQAVGMIFGGVGAVNNGLGVAGGGGAGGLIGAPETAGASLVAGGVAVLGGALMAANGIVKIARGVAFLAKKGPQANGGDGPQHGGTAHDDAIDAAVNKLKSDPSVSNIRKNQQQVDVNGNNVGTNRPDLQYDYDGIHHVVEFDTVPANGDRHGEVIEGNDPKANVKLVTL